MTNVFQKKQNKGGDKVSELRHVFFLWVENNSCKEMELAAMNPPTKMGARVGGGASGATSQLTFTNLQEWSKGE